MRLEEHQVIRHIWFDPGDTTGWAMFHDDTPVKMGTLEYPDQLFIELPALLINQKHVGYEQFTLNPKGAKYGYIPTGSLVVPIRVIGAIEYAAFHICPSARLHTQDKSIKPVGYGYAGLKYVKGKKGTHMQDAVAHGAYWWMEKGRHLAAK